MKIMKSSFLLAALSLCCAPSYAESDQALRFGYKAALLTLETGAEESQIPPAQAKPVQRPLSVLEQRAFALHLRILSSEAHDPKLRRQALKTLLEGEAGPHDRDLIAALGSIIAQTPADKDKYLSSRELDRLALSEEAMDALAIVAARNDAVLTADAVEAVGRLLDNKLMRRTPREKAIQTLVSIAKNKPELAARGLAIQLRILSSETQEADLRKTILNRIKELAPGPQDRDLGLALGIIIKGTSKEVSYFLSERQNLGNDALTVLAAVALRGDAGVAAEAIETVGGLLAEKKRLPEALEASAFLLLGSIAKQRPELADRVLAHLDNIIESAADSIVKDEALKVSSSIARDARESSKARAADPVPGPVKLERIP